MNKVLVIAGAYSEALCWAKEKGLAPTQWVYAAGTNFVGTHFDKFALVGTYHRGNAASNPWIKACLEPDAKDVTNHEIHFTDL